MNRIILLLLFLLAGSTLHAQWTRGTGAGEYFISFLDTRDRLLATSDVGGLYQSHDRGRTWSEIHTGLWEMTFGIEVVVVRDSMMFLGAYGGGVAMSSDNGMTWSAINKGFSGQAFVTSLVLLGDTLYAGMDPSIFPGQIYKTSIDTIEWKRSDIGMPGRKAAVTSLVATGTGVLFASFPSQTAPYAANVYLSFDSARTWQPIPVEQATSVYDLIVDDGEVYAVAGSGLFRLTNGGITWRKLGDIPSRDILVASVAGDRMYVGTLDTGVFTSADAGRSWQAINEGLPYVDDSPLAIWTDGTTALVSLNVNTRTWYRSVPVSRSDDDALSTPGEIDLSLAPNPAQGSTRIDYHLSKAGEVSVRVHNLLGRELISIDESWKSEGDHALDIDTRGLPPGVYHVELQSGTTRQSRRLVVQR